MLFRKKEIQVVIEGMGCVHCSTKVENALNAIEGVRAKVNLKKKTAFVSGTIEDARLREIIEGLGYTVTDIIR